MYKTEEAIFNIKILFLSRNMEQFLWNISLWTSKGFQENSDHPSSETELGQILIFHVIWENTGGDDNNNNNKCIPL